MNTSTPQTPKLRLASHAEIVALAEINLRKELTELVGKKADYILSGYSNVEIDTDELGLDAEQVRYLQSVLMPAAAKYVRRNGRKVA